MVEGAVSVTAGALGAYAGGIAGWAQHAVVDEAMLVGLDLQGASYTGGLFGYALETSANKAAVYGHVAGFDKVGGLTGQLEGHQGGVSFSKFEGSVTGGDNVGGLFGELGSEGGVLVGVVSTDNYMLGSVTGNSHVGGITGRIHALIPSWLVYIGYEPVVSMVERTYTAATVSAAAAPVAGNSPEAAFVTHWACWIGGSCGAWGWNSSVTRNNLFNRRPYDVAGNFDYLIDQNFGVAESAMQNPYNYPNGNPYEDRGFNMLEIAYIDNWYKEDPTNNLYDWYRYEHNEIRYPLLSWEDPNLVLMFRGTLEEM